MENNIGVVLMTYGSATTAENVREYMGHIYHGKADEAVVADFENRYRLVGYSPLVEITKHQAVALEQFLNNDSNGTKNAGENSYIVRAGMLHSHPFIEEAVRACRDAGAERCIGIILSPQFSSFIMGGYRAAFARAAAAARFSDDKISVAGPWPTEPHFIELIASRVASVLEKLRAEYHENVSVIFTTHSLPRRVVEKDPNYLDQLKATTDAILAKIHSAPEIANKKLACYSAYQSAGHTPEEWLKPDITDILEELKKNTGEMTTPSAPRAVLIVPIQFLTDHLEILYDLDIAARAQCEQRGVAYHRIELPNTDPLFIQALAEIVSLAEIAHGVV